MMDSSLPCWVPERSHDRFASQEQWLSKPGTATDFIPSQGKGRRGWRPGAFQDPTCLLTSCLDLGPSGETEAGSTPPLCLFAFLDLPQELLVCLCIHSFIHSLPGLFYSVS